MEDMYKTRAGARARQGVHFRRWDAAGCDSKFQISKGGEDSDGKVELLFFLGCMEAVTVFM